MTARNNYVVFDFKGTTPKNVGWEDHGDAFGYEDCRCVFQAGKAEISKPWFSITPLFYSFQRGRLFISTGWLKLVALLKEYGLDHSPDPLFIRSYLQYQCPQTSHTFCEQIRYLRGGESALIRDGSRDGGVQTVFTDLEDAHHDYPEEEFKLSIRNHLKGLDFQKTCFHLSSGMDSSILAIMAADLCGKGALNAATCTTRGRGSSHEIENVRRLSEELNAGLHVFDFAEIDIFEKGAELIRGCMGYPIGHPSHLVEFLLDSEISGQWDVIVTGRGPDECLGGFEWHQPPFSDPALHRSRITVTDGALLARLLRREVVNPCGLKKGYVFPSRQLSLRDRLLYDLLSISEAWNIITDALSTSLGIEIIGPFLDKGIRSGMFFLPDRAKLDSGNGKVFMRKVFKDVYPEYISTFPKHGLRLDLKPYLDGWSCEDILERMCVNPEFLNKYFNMGEIKELISTTKGSTLNYGWQIWSIYLLSLSSEILKGS